MIELNRISKVFPRNGRNEYVLKDISLKIKKGEFVTFFGPNGSGKTTILKIIAGIVNQTSGLIKTEHRRLNAGFVFQNYSESLLPWRTVFNNIKLPLEGKTMSQRQQRRKIEEKMKMLRIGNYSGSYPYTLSSGKQQLVALCRALITEPEILLLDEPFSSLDYDTTIEMEKMILEIHQKTQITTLFISHEVDEAILLADRVVVLDGKPTQTKDIIDVSLPRPRNHKMLLTKEFLKIKERVIRAYEK